jgi:23S rRNA (cytosine1962-C5)-methyltransferase
VEALFRSEYGSDPNTALLNLFSYTGRFGLAAPGRVVNVDASHEALEQAEQNYQSSGFEATRVEFIQADVFDFLHDQAAEKAQYDVVVLDPPKFAHNARQIEKAARGYKDINLNAFRCIKPGGHLLTFSCSGAISADLFQKIVFGALADSGRQAQILQYLGPGDDHPVALTFPEGAYLKGLLLRVY